ncbi:Caskin-2-like protein [Leptotrombidium deliense]|uniref:Caskin-2-like protein n=1 Tax=Leptotrombidium deliense TaxID=299467 RepID=A0A443SWN3_9ACAR|nr:Caskin-2-like protein [Leptotrombidium deliense]
MNEVPFDSEVLHSWLTSFHYEEYMPLFLKAGYDMPTISRMTPEDLTAIGITKPSHRRKVKAEIQKLNISDGIPTYKPETLEEWLKLLRLHEYYVILCQQGYDTIDRVVELTWEDLEEIGIKKLGHQKRLMLAIKRIQDLDKGVKRSSAQFANNSQSTSCSSISNDSLGSSLSFNYQTSVQNPGQMVPIQTSIRSKSVTSPTVETPTTPELKTFQQLPASDANRNSVPVKQMNYAPYIGVQAPSELNSVLQSSRGRSLESIDRDDMGCKSVYRFHPSYAYNYQHKVQHKSSSGYETDSELLNHNSDINYAYEVDGTATLHRPKGMFKARPVAKIVAKTRQMDNNVTFESFDSVGDYKSKNGGNCVTVDEKSMDNINSVENSWSGSVGGNSCCDGSPARNNFIYKNQSNDSLIYGVVKKKNAPPPPPKRTNSMKSTSTGSYMLRSLSVNDSPDEPPLPARCNSLEAMQEQAFATCVKSIASRFQINDKEESHPPLPARNHTTTPRFSWSAKPEEEFPPPPSPLPHLADSDFSANNYTDDDVNVDNEFDLKVHEKESAMSSSSSSESMPFANDNIGTIKPKVSAELEVFVPEKRRSPTSTVMSAPPSVTTSPFATILRKPKNNCINNYDKNSSNGLAGSKPLLKNLSVLPKPGSSAETISAHRSPSFESRERQIPESNR